MQMEAFKTILCQKLGEFSQNIGNSIEFTLEIKNFLEFSQLLCLKKPKKFPKKKF
jgi:hypothetical protein